MDEKKKASRFGLGMLIGTIVGGLTAFFLSPKSGEENREVVLKKIQELKKQIEKMEIDKKLKEAWGEATDDGRKTLLKVKKQLLKKLDTLSERWQEFDYKSYVKSVEEAVEEAKSETKETSDKLMKLKDLFVKDWKKIFEEKKSK